MTSDETLDLLPPTLAAIARAAGMSAALELAARQGGSEIYIPATPRDNDSLLVRTVGLEAARKIAALYGGENLEIPLGPTVDTKRKRDRIREMLVQGVPVLEIARRLHCHTKTVRRVRDTGGALRQTDLFIPSEE